MDRADFEARVRFKRGRDVEDLVNEMAVEGFDPDEARAAVLRAHARLTKIDRRRGKFNLGLGLVMVACWCAASIAVGRPATSYSFLWLVLTGAGLAVIGARQLLNAGRDAKLARRGLDF
jgi:hypothetical protein